VCTHPKQFSAIFKVAVISTHLKKIDVILIIFFIIPNHQGGFAVSLNIEHHPCALFLCAFGFCGNKNFNIDSIFLPFICKQRLEIANFDEFNFWLFLF
jgi:hypothetical protein